MSNSEAIRTRDQIPQEDTWALEDLYPSDESWEQALSALTARQPEAAAFAGKLGESGETLCAFLHLVEDVDGQSELLANYAMRKADQDTRNAAYQAMVGKLMGVLTAVSAAFSFATPEIMAIPEEALEGFYEGQALITVVPFGRQDSLLAANKLAGKDTLEITVCGHEEQTTVTARFDNLGKGASGAAVQNMNLILGFEETAGLNL